MGMKKIVVFALIVVMVFALGACGKKNGEEPTGDSTSVPVPEQSAGSSSAPDVTNEGEDDENFEPYFDEATGRYHSYLNVSFVVPSGWKTGVDYLNVSGGGAVDVGLSSASEGEKYDDVKMLLIMRRDGYEYSAKENFESRASGHGIDPASGHEVTYGTNKYYCNEGTPGDDGFVVYAYDGGPADPTLYIETNFSEEEFKAPLEELLTSFEYK